VLCRFPYRDLSAQIAAPPDTFFGPRAPPRDRGWRRRTCSTALSMHQGRASYLVGTLGLPRLAWEVGRPAPLLAAWFAVGPASAAHPFSLRLTAEGDPVRAAPSLCGGSMACVSAGHSVMMNWLTEGAPCSSSSWAVPLPRLSGVGAHMHVLSNLVHLMQLHTFPRSPWTWVRFRGWPGPPTSSIVSWVGRPPRVPDPAGCWAVGICLAIRPNPGCALTGPGHLVEMG
jgi:hypothetical protein